MSNLPAIGLATLGVTVASAVVGGRGPVVRFLGTAGAIGGGMLLASKLKG